jgi:predicted dehydrogenase
MVQQPTRRRFLERLTKVAALSGFGAVHSFGQETPDILGLGLIGCGGVMAFHAKRLAANPRATIAWLCDVDPRQSKQLSSEVAQSPTPRLTDRFEDVLSDPSVQAIVIGTPHHWHAPIALRAMSAGKDVYIEKPMSHVYNEGQLIIRAAEKHQRIVHHGTQMRSSPVTEKAGELIAGGILGEVKVARAWSAERRESVRAVPDSDPPAGADYDRWLGPAPARPFNRHRFHKTWRGFRDYGNGEIGDDGIHDLDLACWGLGVSTLPSQITARGGTMSLHDDFSEYPDNMTVAYEYTDGKLVIYEDYPFTNYGQHGYDGGNVFYGTEGYMIFSRRGAFSVFLGSKEKPGPTEGQEIRSRRGSEEHMDRFLEAVRTRRPTNSAPEVAHRSCALVHLGEIAYRTQGQLTFDPTSERFVDGDEANTLLTKTYREPYSLV